MRIRHRYYTAESQAIHDARFEDRNKGEMTDEDWKRAEPILKFMRWHRRRGRPQEDLADC